MEHAALRACESHGNFEVIMSAIHLKVMLSSGYPAESVFTIKLWKFQLLREQRGIVNSRGSRVTAYGTIIDSVVIGSKGIRHFILRNHGFPPSNGGKESFNGESLGWMCSLSARNFENPFSRELTVLSVESINCLSV